MKGTPTKKQKNYKCKAKRQMYVVISSIRDNEIETMVFIWFMT